MNDASENPPSKAPDETPGEMPGRGTSYSVAFLAVVLAVLFVSLWLRSPALPHSLWVDELHTAWVVEDGLAEISARALLGNQSPLYFYGVWPVRAVLGRQELSYRLLSVVAGLGLIVTAMLAARRYVGGWIAPVVAGLILAIDRDMIFFSTEARVYSLIQWGVVLHLLLALGIIRHPRRGLFVLWSVSGAALFYLHYTAALPLAVEGLLVLVLAKDRAARVHFLLAGLGTAVLCLPMVWHLVEIAGARENWAAFIRHDSPGEWRRWREVGLVSLPMVVLAIGDFCFRANLRDRRWSPLPGSAAPLLAVLGVAVLPVLLAYGLTASGTLALFFGRYLIASQTLLLLVPLVMAACVRPGWIRGAGLIVTLLVVLWIRPNVPRHFDITRWAAASAQMRGENWRDATTVVRQRVEPMDRPPALLVASGLIESDGLRGQDDQQLWQYSLLPVLSIYHLPVPTESLVPLTYSRPGQLTDTQIEAIGDADRIILIFRGSLPRMQQTEKQITERIGQARQSRSQDLPPGEVLFRSRGLQVVEFELPPSP